VTAPNWAALLTCSDKGVARPNHSNAVLVLQHDPACGPEAIWYDEFLDRVLVQASPVREWRDDDDTRLTVFMQDHCLMTAVPDSTVAKAVRYVARQRPRHCVRDWLRSLTWDGIDRLATAFEDYWGADGSLYTRAASVNFFVGLVARVMRPGCKLDTMPVFEGEQGLLKSTALEVLGGPWYAVAHERMDAKDFLQGLRGKWLIEIAELQSFSKPEVTAVKTLMSTAVDDYRPSYARHVQRFPRQCVFAGTTNTDDWGTDETGLRRFWPIACGAIDVPALRDARPQLFAEAVARFDAGATWWRMPDETAAVQHARQYEDSWTATILAFAAGQSPTYGFRLGDCLTQALDLPLDRLDKRTEMRAARILRLHGFARCVVRLAPHLPVQRRWLLTHTVTTVTTSDL
jgi:putative DNA primase/helicase